MAQSYTKLLYHIIFSTKNRQPLIKDEYEARLYDYIGGTIRSLNGVLLLKISSREEFIQFLKANGVEYDERYL